MRADHKTPGMQQIFNIWLLNLHLAVPLPPKILVLCSFVPVCLMKKTLRTYKKLAVLIYKQHGTYGAELPKEEGSPWLVQFHMLDNPLPAGTTFASITWFFISSNKQILKTFYVSGPTQNPQHLRGHSHRTDTGPACSWSSHSFCSCTCAHPHTTFVAYGAKAQWEINCEPQMSSYPL